MIAIAKMYFGESANVNHVSQEGLPIFGRYAAMLREDLLWVDQADDGTWYVRLPLGSTMCVTEWTRDEAINWARAIARDGYDGWIQDRDRAVFEAKEDARIRHNNRARLSAAYAARYGGPVA
jgi:hypothetical protein